MYKFFNLLLLAYVTIFLSSYDVAAKNPPVKTVKASFILHNKGTTENTEFSEEFDYCAETLSFYSEIQKKRKLTLEEMMLVLKIILFLFNTQLDQQTKFIEIMLNDQYKIIVPYSSQIFAALTQQLKEESAQE